MDLYHRLEEADARVGQGWDVSGRKLVALLSTLLIGMGGFSVNRLVHRFHAANDDPSAAGGNIGKTQRFVAPGPPGLGQLLGLGQPKQKTIEETISCFFDYQLLSQREPLTGFSEDVEGTIIGAKVVPSQSGPGGKVLAVSTGHPADTVKGRLKCWDCSADLLKQLPARDEAWASVTTASRQVVEVVKDTGKDVLAFTFFTTPQKAVANVVEKPRLQFKVRKADVVFKSTLAVAERRRLKSMLVDEIIELSKKPLPEGRTRWLIGLVGVPGSGKSFLANTIKRDVNNYAKANIVTVVPMDGFHLTRKQLDAMPDPALAHARRGAQWTFDPKGLGELLLKLRTEPGDVKVPSFDHAKKDPVPDDITVRQEPVVLVEGLYLFLDKGDWATYVLPQFDKRWALMTDPAVAEERVIKRHMRTGVANTWSEAQERWDYNDGPNGCEVLEHLDDESIEHFIALD
eukprot:g55462.t1